MSKDFLYVSSDDDFLESESFESADFINATTGASDAAKPLITNASGFIDQSFLNLSAISHDDLDDLDTTSHPNYSLINGTRDYTAVVSYSSALTISSDEQLVHKQYVDNAVSSSGTASEWQDSCITIELDSSNIVTPSVGDRYLIAGTGVNDFSGHDQAIAEWGGSAWSFTAPTTGTYTSCDDQSDRLYYYGGSAWTAKYYEATTASLGVKRVGLDVQADLQTAGGLKLNGNQILVEPSDFAGTGLEDDGSDNLRIATSAYGDGLTGGAGVAATVVVNDLLGDGIVNDGSNNFAIDWFSAWTDDKAVKASDFDAITTSANIGVDPSTIDLVSASTVQGAFQQLGTEVKALADVSPSIQATASSAIAIGAGCVISGSEQVEEYDITSTGANKVVGLAGSAVTSGNTVEVHANDTIIEGVLTGATPGTVYYLNTSGNGITNVRPTASGTMVVRAGAAWTSTALWVQTKVVKRNK